MTQSTYPNLSNELPPSGGSKPKTLLSQYIHILTRPSVRTFIEEKSLASWRSIWWQLLILGFVSALLSALAAVITPPQIGNVPGTDPTTLRFTIATISAIFVLVATPCAFFAASGVLYLFARLFKGKGTYLEQTYTLILFGVPMVLLGSLLFLIPTWGNWLTFVPHIYSLVLLVLALRAVHQGPSLRKVA